MGNWRTVRIEGTCDEADLPQLRDLLTFTYESGESQEKYDVFCLGYSDTPSLYGLNNWPATSFDLVGNLHERDYGVDDVEKALRMCVDVAPSLRAVIDCGGEYESDECVATVLVGEDGTVATVAPRVTTLPEISKAQMTANLARLGLV